MRCRRHVRVRSVVVVVAVAVLILVESRLNSPDALLLCSFCGSLGVM